jgi:hypothetical protein
LPVFQHKTCKIACACWVIFSLHNFNECRNVNMWQIFIWAEIDCNLNFERKIQSFLSVCKHDESPISLNRLSWNVISAVLFKWTENGNSETTLQAFHLC